MNGIEQEESVSSNLRRSRAGRKKVGAIGPVRKFWRRYHLTKIFLILGLSASLFVGVYLFALAKSTNVTDLQNALKTRTLIFDREEKEAGACQVKKAPMSNFRTSVKTYKMPSLLQKIEVSIRTMVLTMLVFS